VYRRSREWLWHQMMKREEVNWPCNEPRGRSHLTMWGSGILDSQGCKWYTR
jgi:hypothetical protein